MKNSSVYILKKLLKAHTIKLDEKELEFQLLSHPSYPSLHSLTSVLDHFKIKNMALEVPNNSETTDQLPKAFIAYIKDERIEDLVFVAIADFKVQVIYNDKKREELSFDEFCRIWTGVIIAVEKDEEITTKTKVHLKVLTKGVLFLTLAVLFTLFFFLNQHYFKPCIFYCHLLDLE